MTKQDSNGVRNARDLETKYNLAQILKLKKNFEMFETSLTKINNELNNTMNALLINLSSMLDTQDEISLWYAEGVPTLDNFPSNTWKNLTEHYGDLYYNQLTGYVYQFGEDKTWHINDDINLIQAMALTNIEVDTTEDKERKIFFKTPTPPYSSGDWWIKEDGTLYICQLGKNTGNYEENDFIISSKYTATIAVKENNTIKVIKGTLQEITEDYVKYTDLSTGGSTTIAGENVTTGSIKSQNYVAGTSGMKIDLVQGTIDSKNSKLDENGNWVLKNGATVISDKGLKNIFLYREKGSVGPTIIESGYNLKHEVNIDIIIPENLEITKANILLIHFPQIWYKPDNANYYYGSSKNLKIFHSSSLNIYQLGALNGWGEEVDNTEYTIISKSFNTTNGSFSANDATSSSHDKQEIESVDIKSYIQKGLNRFCIKTTDPSVNYNISESGELSTEVVNATKRTGYIYALLKIEGFMSYQNN